jgi:hypothetical protein
MPNHLMNRHGLADGQFSSVADEINQCLALALETTEPENAKREKQSKRLPNENKTTARDHRIKKYKVNGAPKPSAVTEHHAKVVNAQGGSDFFTLFVASSSLVAASSFSHVMRQNKRGD